MSTKTNPRRTARAMQAEVGRWYTSTIDGTTTGRVVEIAGRVTRIQMSGGRIDECRGAEFEDSWS